MPDDTGTQRVWMVEREYTSGGLVTVVYATADGERQLRRQLSERMVVRSDVTAAEDVDPERLESTPESERERYAAEAARMAADHDPDDVV
jgi:hypothetical protein